MNTCKMIAIYNQKGGVGKSATTVKLSIGLVYGLSCTKGAGTGKTFGVALYTQAWKLAEYGRDTNWCFNKTLSLPPHSYTGCA